MLQSLRLVAPCGTTETRRLPASGAGPAEHRLYAGSEGTLGVITEAWVRLRKRPTARASATVLFSGSDADDAFSRGAAAVREIALSGLQPANLRLVYGNEIARTQAAGQGNKLAHAAVLLLGLEAEDASWAALLDAQLLQMLEVAEAKHKGSVVAKRLASVQEGAGAGEREGIAGSWGQGFMAGGYNFSVSCLMPDVILNTFETACTWRDFPRLHQAALEATRAAIRRECGVEGEVTCRFTHVYPDGPAPYYTIVVRGVKDTTPSGGEDHRITRWLEIKRAAMDAVIANGGTATHHHAIGRLHRPHYEAERGALFGPTLSVAKAKHDPAGIMAPGVLLPPSRTPLDPTSKL
eukprot:gnl/TRDRNA2_/TRDRNA2_118155_c1_seq1.p1 gnl/TRDRNA2_/TRDRNA2_118155_c1~~gnl/TRDRNA2_/TRDRNA2_118155_c1_seq1.p1  ORF type:complete len:411 (-),score=74.96 gnl/TRDRNA2_/TRDRNA2_118155_c1_seq1:57-1109(-)